MRFRSSDFKIMINLIYRAPASAFSIENVFNAVFDELRSNNPIKKTILPYYRANCRSVTAGYMGNLSGNILS